ncbi:DNA topoisomerase IV subunit B [Bartonella sp. DGB1]|uniref:DNA topoisomerase IV subunit B n=1 Tax=Bartonella sp. DGB1 TaxID=3239807 RepID=UPI0035254748
MKKKSTTSNDKIDLFSCLVNEHENKKTTAVKTDKSDNDYNASSIKILEGLEPVRLRPGMYIGGTDKKALHHLFAEVIDNAMDEAIAGHASKISVTLNADGSLTVSDNGRGIPIEPHPQMPNISTLEVIMTKLHAGGKFEGNAYETSGGLHGVGISVVNALSDFLTIEVARNKKLYRQNYSRGIPQTPLEEISTTKNKGTSITFHPDSQIFGSQKFDPHLLFEMSRSKAYLFGGIEITWQDNFSQPDDKSPPTKEVFLFSGGLKDYLLTRINPQKQITKDIFAGKIGKPGKHGYLEWAISWQIDDSFINSYCNTVPTREGGTHESGLRLALTKGLKAYGEFIGKKRANNITTEDILSSINVLLSVFVREPEFVGQTKDRLATVEAQKLVENSLRDPFDHWLAQSPTEANKLLDWILERVDERLKRRQEREVNRKTATKKLRLPGKLADCVQSATEGAEIFIVEGDSAGGSAKQARNRAFQAVLPLRGKILNVASASREKLLHNQQIQDLLQAIGVQTGSKYREEDLRYDKIIIMTDADVDGAHIASLLITFFYQEIPQVIEHGHLYLAVPPLFRLNQGGKIFYARDEEQKQEIIKNIFKGRGKIEINRFKGLGEMRADQLKQTTMAPENRNLLKIVIAENDKEITKQTIDNLMGTKPETRFKFIQENAAFANNIDI